MDVYMGWSGVFVAFVVFVWFVEIPLCTIGFIYNTFLCFILKDINALNCFNDLGVSQFVIIHRGWMMDEETCFSFGRRELGFFTDYLWFSM